jgi:hypothetical protein
MTGGTGNLLYLTTSLLGRASQRLWLFLINDVYQEFTFVVHTLQPWPLSALTLADPPLLTEGVAAFRLWDTLSAGF